MSELLANLLTCAFILATPLLCLWLFSRVELYLWRRRERDRLTDHQLRIGMRLLQRAGRL